MIRFSVLALALALPCLAVAAPAAAPAVDLQRFQPDATPLGAFAASGGEVLRHLEFAVGAHLNWARNPLVVIESGGRTSATIRDNGTLQLHGAIGLFDRLELGFVVPAVVYQAGDDPRLGAGPQAALGDIRVVPRVRLLTQWQHGVSLSFAPLFTLPSGNPAAFAGEGSATVSPQVTIVRRGPGTLLASTVTYRSRSEGALVPNAPTSSELAFAVAGGRTLFDGLEALVELNGAFPFKSGATVAESIALEAMAGVRARVGDQLALDLGAGGGILSAPGTPDWRIVGGVTYGAGLRPQPAFACLREEAGNRSTLLRELGTDQDSDGIDDACDLCPAARETRNDYKDLDGCPETDKDGDGLYDDEDRCIDAPGPFPRGCPDQDLDGVFDTSDECIDVKGVAPTGCPDTDADGLLDRDDQCITEQGPAPYGCPDRDEDGLIDKADQCPDESGFPPSGCPDSDADYVIDKLDKCPDKAEDVDGFEDDDGCPEDDNDFDGFTDDKDLCPDQEEDRDGFQDDDGCPDPDNDGDGILDEVDQCPEERETINGVTDDDGCPDEGESLVALEKDRITPKAPVFFVAGKAELDAKGLNVVSQAALLVRANRQLRKVVVEVSGETDDQAGDDLAQARAETVLKLFVEKGVDAKRIVTQVGEPLPADVLATASRVQFFIASIVYGREVSEGTAGTNVPNIPVLGSGVRGQLANQSHETGAEPLILPPDPDAELPGLQDPAARTRKEAAKAKGPVIRKVVR